jgi:ComF family protein
LSIWRNALTTLLPQDCLLCASGPADALLCPACLAELPRLPDECCPVCAEASPGGAVCGTCLKTPPQFDATVAIFRYAFPVDKLVHALKYQRRLATADFLSGAMLAAPRQQRPTGDVIVPLPLSAARLRERGFNQAVELARPLARALRLPILLDGCTRSRDTAPQAMLPWQERRRNVRHAFECSLDLSGKAIIVVDDVMTTGATLDEFAGTLKAHGAARVINWIAARTLKD